MAENETQTQIATASKPNQRSTSYAVLSAESKDGPWTYVGIFDAHGQPGAKRLAAAKIGDDAAKLWFIAMPASAWVPQKPKIKVTTQISFAL